MKRTWLSLIAFTLVVCMPVRPVGAQRDDIGAPRGAAPLTILQLNDVYSTGPVNDLGGLARVATLKKTLATEGRTPFLDHHLVAAPGQLRPQPIQARATGLVVQEHLESDLLAGVVGVAKAADQDQQVVALPLEDLAFGGLDHLGARAGLAAGGREAHQPGGGGAEQLASGDALVGCWLLAVGCWGGAVGHHW